MLLAPAFSGTFLNSQILFVFVQSAVPIVEPEAEHLVGLIAPRREPQTPVLAALIDEAVRLAARSGL